MQFELICDARYDDNFDLNFQKISSLQKATDRDKNLTFST